MGLEWAVPGRLLVFSGPLWEGAWSGPWPMTPSRQLRLSAAPPRTAEGPQMQQRQVVLVLQLRRPLEAGRPVAAPPHRLELPFDRESGLKSAKERT